MTSETSNSLTARFALLAGSDVGQQRLAGRLKPGSLILRAGGHVSRLLVIREDDWQDGAGTATASDLDHGRQ